MTFLQLKLFVKIAETGSFTKAGLELNMTQPAVSRAISSLEHELDVTLLIRDRRTGILLTELGKRMLVHFRDILQGYEKVEQEAAAEKGFEVGTIRIGSFPTASAYFLPKIFRVIGEKYPRLKFDLLEGSIDEIREWLAARIVDVGWLIPPTEEFETVTMLREEMVAYLRDDHPLQSREVIRIEDLSGIPLIICKGGYEIPIYEQFQRRGALPNTKYAVHNVSTALNMVQEGLGFAIISGSSVSLSVLPPNVRPRMLEPKPYREIHLAVPSMEESSIAVKLFVQTARELFLKTTETSGAAD
ncbi:LysR family transcriptional regulator [Paenibacillus filicis]|uniref:LysR family transcriptional regulator n=1 Tax=Paenibacillus filicis TaxID=669464 RepID=A0ABU9DEP2_9BACL